MVRLFEFLWYWDSGCGGKKGGKGSNGSDHKAQVESCPAEKVQGRDLMEQGWLGFNGLLHGKRQVSQTTATKLIPVFAKILFQ